MTINSLNAGLDRDGFAIIPDVLACPAIDHLLEALNCAEINRAKRKGAVYGGRNLLALQEVRNLAADPAVRALITPIVGAEAMPVRALFFDKTPQANWPVLWHQDLMIAVDRKHVLEDWGPWSTKAGVTHVEPPQALLAAMLTIRIHLDDCSADNGPLRVIPGIHVLGRLSRDRIREITATTDHHTCLAPLGSALLMRPLLLHASSPAKHASHRRVVHIEFAADSLLPPPLNWAHAPDPGVDRSSSLASGRAKTLT